MSDLQDALDGIRELHENDYDEGRWSWGGDPYDNARQTAGRLLAAVEAVLELHVLADFGECNECSNGTPYPCATVKAIQGVTT